ncbi:hypothetical protein [Leptolyngbya sp. FACHB-261]|uniref:hypothetical protein n=1 Tax=Leptolyngbya sp. FACHB-261 TaxID=2692806 RepID=UPI00168989DB|nr:hypothetical protein [Leptolyngbya sp. FACHB-261]MBD2104235.1 hypothetical protein [Leptolyngbya sp. FACHB-261]
MQPQKVQKIELTTSYPCPCRRRGQIVPIALTEAFGCERCQQIFVVEEGGYSLEQLSTSYPYKRAWHWTGHQWSAVNRGLGENYLTLAMTFVLAPLLLLWLTLALQVSLEPQMILWSVVTLMLVVILVVMVWLALRRRS